MKHLTKDFYMQKDKTLKIEFNNIVLSHTTVKKRFDKLTNRDIAKNYKDKEFYFMRRDFLGAFACWVVRQSKCEAPNIEIELNAFKRYIGKKINKGTVVKFTYKELREFINEQAFMKIPEIEKLNHGDGFIDLSALSRNIVFTLLREFITES